MVEAIPMTTVRQRYRAAGGAVIVAAAIALLVMSISQFAIWVLPKRLQLDLSFLPPLPAVALPIHWARAPHDERIRDLECDWRDGAAALADPAAPVVIRCRGRASGPVLFMPTPPMFQGPQWQTQSARMTADLEGSISKLLAWTLGPLLAAIGLIVALGRQRPWRADLANAVVALRRPWRVLAPAAAAISVAALANAAGWMDVDPAVERNMLDTFRQPAILALMLLAPLWEELLLRGWLWQRLRPTLPLWLTTLVVTELFVALHAGTPQMGVMSLAYVMALTASGLALAWLRERFDSVSLCILAHAIQNGTAAVMLLSIP
jgi:membrane protease YdiL (CAAX protease family)